MFIRNSIWINLIINNNKRIKPENIIFIAELSGRNNLGV
jgi:hypothetical protein